MAQRRSVAGELKEPLGLGRQRMTACVVVATRTEARQGVKNGKPVCGDSVKDRDLDSPSIYPSVQPRDAAVGTWTAWFRRQF